MRCTTCLIIALALSVSLSARAAAAEPTSENDDRLARWLKRFPEADADKDGVLSMSEARAYRRRQQEQRGAREGGRRGGRASVKPDFAEVKYGPHERNVLDFWKAESDAPTPVLVFFHGGGFVGGRKSLSGAQRHCLTRGISAASANYRFVTPKGVTLREVMEDGARVVQFLRSKAEEWGLDPKRIALSGGSAGANMSIWLALHDDLADAKNDDPIKRFSTRITCVIAGAGQTSNDPRFIRKHIGGNPTIYPSVPKMYDADSIDELETPEMRRMVDEYSAINHATKDDPPLYLTYSSAPPEGLYPEDAPIGKTIHSARFGILLKEKMDALGVECIVAYPGNVPAEKQIRFLLRQFGMIEPAK